MERAEEIDEAAAAAPSRGSIRSRLSNRADPFLVVCRCFSVVTSLIAILCVVVNVLAVVRSFRDSHDLFDGIFRCYAVLIACFVVLAETEWSFIIQFSKVDTFFSLSLSLFYYVCLSSHFTLNTQVLEFWAGRGMLQIFAAVMTRSFPDYLAQKKDLILLQNIASYMLLACGVIYVVSGVLCIGCLKRARQKKEVSRDQAVRDLEEIDRRREELEQLLVEHQRRDDVA
ncbi:unnamed protein product [Cochlearia groenlandica]